MHTASSAPLLRLHLAPLSLVMLLAAASACTSATETTTPATEKPTGESSTGTPAPAEEVAAPPPAEAAPLCVTPAGTVADVSVSALKQLLDSGAKLAIIDVREPDETATGTIKGALLYPWTGKVLQARHAELPTDRPIYVICRSGNRSSAATTFLADNGHACIHDVQGGMNAWTAASYPTE